MYFHLLASIIFLGFTLLLGILQVMRALYAYGICEPPALASDVEGSFSALAQAPRTEST